jgi:hypothetical protein
MEPNVIPDIGAPLKTTLDIVIAFGTDFFAFIVVAAVIGAFAFYFGSDRLNALIAGVYATIRLYLMFPYRLLLPATPWFSIGLFIVFVALATTAFSGLSYFMASNSVGFLRVGALSILTAGFIIAVAIHVLPIQDVYAFSPPTEALFVSDFSYFWWLVAPLAGLFFLGRT